MRPVLLAFAGLLLLGGGACRSPRTPLPEVPEAMVAAEARRQQIRFLEEDDARRERLHRVSFPLLREALVLFDTPPRPAVGVLLLTAEAYPEHYRATARELWDLDGAPRVQHVAPGSPAEKAGLRRGDRIVAVAGKSLPEKPAAFLGELRRALEAGSSSRLTIERDGLPREVTVTAANLADYRVRLRYTEEINARATGRAIEVNRAMIDFCRDDAELAFIVAHEIAHNALRHHRDFVLNYLAGSAADLALLLSGIPTPNALGLINLLRPAADFESEADVVALSLLVEAGFDPADVLDFWPRLAALQPEVERGPLFLGTHPDYATRQARLRLVVETLQGAESGPR